MPLSELPYQRLEPLLREHLSVEEDSDAYELIRQFREVKKRGYLTANELEQVCRWKSARAMRHIRANSPAMVEAATQTALGTRSERQRLEALLGLRGVSVPMASAVLMVVDPKRYGVIDIRVWQLLHKLGTVTKNPSGQGFSFGNWYQFLMILRHFAKKLGVQARDVERTLFHVHREYQDGRLYDRLTRAT